MLEGLLAWSAACLSLVAYSSALVLTVYYNLEMSRRNSLTAGTFKSFKARSTGKAGCLPLATKYGDCPVRL